MKAKDLIKILETNPEADILIEDAGYYSPALAGVYLWSPTASTEEVADWDKAFVFATQEQLDEVQVEADDEQVYAFADFALNERDDC